MPSLLHLVLAGEAEGQTEILQLHEIDVARRILRDPVQHLEELLSAPRLSMQRHQQRMLRPFALIAPGRRQDRLVEAGAQRIPRGEDDLVRHAGRARLLLESANLLEGVTPEARHVHRRERLPHLSRQQQQRTRRPHERVQSDAEQRARRCGNRRRHRSPPAPPPRGRTGSTNVRLPAPGRGRIFVASGRRKGSSLFGMRQPRISCGSPRTPAPIPGTRPPRASPRRPSS